MGKIVDQTKAHALLARARSAISTYRRTVRKSALETAITSYEALLDALPMTSPQTAEHKIALSKALEKMSDFTGDVAHARRAVALAQEAVEASSPNNLQQIDPLLCLGRAYQSQWSHLRDKDVALSARQCFEHAIDLAGPNHPRRASLLSACGSTFQDLATHVEGDDQLEYIKKAIKLQESALRLLRHDSKERAMIMRIYARCLISFNELAPHEEKRLDDAVSIAQQSVALTPVHHHRRHVRLNVLAFAHYRRWRLRDCKCMDDMDLARRYSAEAIDSIPPEHHNCSTYKFNLSCSMVDVYEITGCLETLEDAIAKMKELMSTLTEHHPHFPTRTKYLGKALLQLFRNRGHAHLLDEAIECHEKGVSQAPPAEAWRCLHDLGEVLLERYHHQQDPASLEQAVQVFDKALVGRISHQRHQVLVSLANALTTRFASTQDCGDLEQAIQLFQAVLKAGGHVEDISQVYDAYGLAMLSRFRGWDAVEDLEAALGLFGDAIKACSTQHPSLPEYHCHLGIAHRLLYPQKGCYSDLDQSILALRTSLKLSNPLHPLLAHYHYELAISMKMRFSITHAEEDMDECCDLLQFASEDESSFVTDRFTAARERAELLHTHAQHERLALESYKLAISFLPRIAWLGLEEHVRCAVAEQWIALGSDAAACAISAGQYCMAVEFLENSRSVLWNQRFQLRAQFHEVRRLDRSLYEELMTVGKALESNLRSSPEIGSNEVRQKEAEQRARARRHLAEKWEELLKRVRTLPGAEDFLGWQHFRHIAKAADAGPVIAINVSRFRCDAIVIGTSDPADQTIASCDPPLIVPLASITHERVKDWEATMMWVLHGAESRKAAEEVFRQLLSEMWREICHPLWRALSLDAYGDCLPRVWLMPTGALASLPLHAATSAEPDSFGMHDIMIPSYTPTLSTLIRARQTRWETSDFKMLVIGAANPLGHDPLSCWPREKRAINGHFSSEAVTVLEDEAANTRRVLDEVRRHNFLHIGCHGVYDWMNPYDSHLALNDGELTLRTIGEQEFKRVDFALLAACSTATAHPRAPDESLNIARGMNVAGFRSIIATLWDIYDKDAPAIANRVYSYFTRDGKVPDPLDGAKALHAAINAAKAVKVPALRWAAWIHVGI